MCAGKSETLSSFVVVFSVLQHDKIPNMNYYKMTFSIQNELVFLTGHPYKFIYIFYMSVVMDLMCL